MASVAAKVANAGVLIPLFSAASGAVAAYGGYTLLVHHAEWAAWASWFVRGPGRTSRLLLALFVVLNAKSMPLVWTFRVFGAIVRHAVWPRRAAPPLPPAALFHYSVTHTRTTLLETDYNFHKSNSTYFADLDPARSHLVMRLLGPGIAAASNNARTRLVCKPAEAGCEGKGDGAGTPYPGVFSIGLGSVFCSFRREIAPFQTVELWTRVLAWDRKWLYLVTHFVVKGKVRPGQAAVDEAALQRHVVATAISKYVFKLDRFTVHPTYLMEASGVLPARPGAGWRGGGPDAVGDMADVVDGVDSNDDDSDTDWDWKRVERKRREGMAVAAHFAALDGAATVFDGGRNGYLGRFFPG